MNHKPTQSKGFTLALIAGIGLVVLISYGGRISSLEHNYSYDQGIHLILARLWAAGYVPYQEIFISYPPVFLWSMGLPWQIFYRPEALQLLMATYAIVGVVAIVYLGAVYNSLLAGVVAGLLLSFAPAYFDRSITIMGEVPSIGVAVAAVALAEKYRRDGGWGWLVAAGSTLAISLSLKILPFYAVPFLGVIVLARFIVPGSWAATKTTLSGSKKRLVRDMLILGGSFSVVFLLPVLFFDPAALFDQVVGMRLASRETQFNALTSNNQSMVGFIFGSSGTTALALYGLIFVVANDIKRYWLLLVWFVFIWISMYFHVPLRSKHLPILLPVLALFAGFAVNHIVYTLKTLPKRPYSAATAAMLLAVLVVVGMFLWNVGNSLAGGSSGPRDDDETTLAEDQVALDFIQAIARPDDCVVADDPVFLYHTNRLPPPELAEVSHTRIRTGYLTYEDVITALEHHECYVVVNLTPRFGEELPGLTHWLAENYLALYLQGEAKIYFAPLFESDDYDRVSGNFDNLLALKGVQLPAASLSRQQPGYVALVWQVNAPLPTGLVERISLRPKDKEAPTHHIERPFFAGASLSPEWQPGDQARDSFRLMLPDNLTPGTYEMYLALCPADALACLPLTGQQTEGLYLGQITVSAE